MTIRPNRDNGKEEREGVPYYGQLSEGRVYVLYSDHITGGMARRKLMPMDIFYGCIPGWPVPQWLLRAFDMDRGEQLLFAMQDIHQWQPVVDDG
jgi:hypothetical protein